jgi:hypothetical protein
MQAPNASPQGIASLYMGNPGALQQKVDKEQKAHPGLPPDLKDLMALNIVTNEQDAAKRQEAMNALNQMAPGGQPPTVAQSIQEQAKQKLQAQMLQQQRQQQGLQALAQAQPGASVPEGTPQPEQQGQGIDQLPAELQLAGGGIVAFKKGDEVEEKDKEEKVYPGMIRMAGRPLLDETTGLEGKSMMDLLGMLGDAAKKYFSPEREAANAAAMYGQKPAPAPAAAPAQPNQAALARQYEQAVATGNAGAAPSRAPAPAPAPAPQATPRPAAAPQAAAPAPAAPTGIEAAYQKYIEKGLNADPEIERAKAVEAYEKAVGRPDTSQYDRLVQELEGRKAQFNAPAKGFDAFAELMQNIAAQGPQRKWYESGAKGAIAQTALDKERQAQQHDLTKQAAEVAQKKIDADRAYRKELYTTGADAAKRIEEIAKETAKEFGVNKRDEAGLVNRITTANIAADATKAAARIGAEARSEGGADKQRLNELKALQKQYTDQLKTTFNKDDKAALRRNLAAIEAEIAKMAGMSTMPGAPGASGPGGALSGWGKAQVVK